MERTGREYPCRKSIAVNDCRSSNQNVEIKDRRSKSDRDLQLEQIRIRYSTDLEYRQYRKYRKFASASEKMLRVGILGFLVITPCICMMNLLARGSVPLLWALTMLSMALSFLVLVMSFVVMIIAPFNPYVSSSTQGYATSKTGSGTHASTDYVDHHHDCSICKGTGRCTYCRGSGLFNYQARSDPRMYPACTFCLGTGVCTSCNGKGRWS